MNGLDIRGGCDSAYSTHRTPPERQMLRWRANYYFLFLHCVSGVGDARRRAPPSSEPYVPY